MKDDIVSKLRATLDVGITSEAHVVYLMVQCRKLLEHLFGKPLTSFNDLDFFCSWAVHTKMTFNPARQKLLLFDGTKTELQERGAYSRPFRQFESLSTFRKELKQLLKTQRLPFSIASKSNEWEAFLNLYSRVVADCPLTYDNTDVRFQKVKALTLNGVSVKPAGASIIKWTITPLEGRAFDYKHLYAFRIAPPKSS